MSDKEAAVIVGVGPGLGAALARRFSAAGLLVAIAGRDQSKVQDIATAIGPDVHAYGCDVTVEDQVKQLFDAVQRELGAPSIAIHNVGAYLRKSILESTKDDLEMCWRLCCLGGFLVGRAAARIMVPRGRGTILFTGATSSLRGAALFHNNAVAKFGVRAISQSMARELQPMGVHVAHVVIDGAIESEHLRSILDKRDPNTFLPPDDIAEAYYQLHRQHRGAWTQEIDLRSWKEGF
jgi:NAD(P)-dependent dehydrogenase (short-subunit alcohol dehydrogenase family)